MLGKYRITLDTPEYSGNFTANLLMNTLDSILITVTGPFGMHLGKVYVTKNNFLFYNQVMNQFYRGSQQQFEGRNFLQFPVEIKELKNIFIAQDHFNVLHKELFEIRDDNYFIEASNGKYRYRIWFEPEHYLLRKIEYLDNDKILYYKEYDNFRKVNGIYFPHLVNFVRPEENEGIAIIVTDLELNEPIEQDEFDIKISDSATQIDLSL